MAKAEENRYRDGVMGQRGQDAYQWLTTVANSKINAWSEHDQAALGKRNWDYEAGGGEEMATALKM